MAITKKILLVTDDYLKIILKITIWTIFKELLLKIKYTVEDTNRKVKDVADYDGRIQVILINYRIIGYK